MTRYSITKNILILLFLHLFLVTSTSFAAEKEEKLISMDFDNADIRVVIKFVSELTGKNIIIDNKVKGKVTVISPTRISPSEAFKVFESILEVNGFSVVESAGILKIVSKPDASKSLLKTRVGKESRRVAQDDKIITQIIPLDYASSTQVRGALAPLISKNGIIIDYPATNTLIITGISSNIHRLIKIIQEIDVTDIKDTLEVIPLQYVDAEYMAKQLASIFPLNKAAPKTAASKKRRRPVKAATSGQKLKIIPYSRTNSLIVVADESDLEEIKELLKVLDVETTVEEGEVHVYYLNNAVADDLAKVLSAMSQKKGAAPPGKALPISGNIIITPDKATNALVITSSPQDYRVVKGVIEKLDIRRKQVYVEATIMEISLDKQRELGVEFRGTSNPVGSSDVKVIGGSTFGGIEAASANPLGLGGQGLVVGAVDGTIQFGSATYYNIGALLRALEQESGVNVLSTPHLLTMDNEEAEIIIGENVPFVTSRSETTAGQPITTIERKDVGIKLKITPQINESDYVKLKIFQEISNVKEVQIEGAADLITTKRSARTTIVAKSGQTVAIGGLIRDNEFEVVSKVPCLGDIPLLGWLFRYKQNRKEKTNLLIFLTPKIIRDAESIKKITEEKRDNLERFRDENMGKKKKTDSDSQHDQQD